MADISVLSVTRRNVMQRANDVWCDKLKQWATKRLGEKQDNDFYDSYNGYISEHNLLTHWYTESTGDGSSVQRQRALRSAIVHMHRAKENELNGLHKGS